jgi:ubiquinone/menaquinone biosynthesis C-methylase UbiE
VKEIDMVKAQQLPTPDTRGRVLHGADRYDVLVWLVTFGRERALRERMIRLACLEPGETVLDVGCGTGTLAIAAKRHVGPSGVVHGIDASPAMVARASRKARKTGVDVVFENGVVETLPYSDTRFDAVLSTLMLHHLPRDTRRQCIAEVRRVLKPGGRMLVVDFARPQRKHGFFAHFHRHGHVDVDDVVAMMNDSGFAITERGALGFSSLQFVLASSPSRNLAD